MPSLLLLAYGVTAAACVRAVACIPAVAVIAGVPLVPDVLSVAGLPAIAGITCVVGLKLSFSSLLVIEFLPSLPCGLAGFIYPFSP
jgi:hypothetical protein